mgnify:CR=1 FL=1
MSSLLLPFFGPLIECLAFYCLLRKHFLRRLPIEILVDEHLFFGHICSFYWILGSLMNNYDNKLVLINKNIQLVAVSNGHLPEIPVGSRY